MKLLLVGQLWYKHFHENLTKNTNGLTDGRTCEVSV